MTTKPPPKIKQEQENSAVKKIYTMLEEFKDVLPVSNDRYRIGFCLYRYYTGEAGSVKEALSSAAPITCKIDLKELGEKINEKYNSLNLEIEK